MSDGGKLTDEYKLLESNERYNNRFKVKLVWINFDCAKKAQTVKLISGQCDQIAR